MDANTKRIYHDVERPQFTPERITTLKKDEIFVFGSNLKGMHGGGAARIAKLNFGAIMGQGIGLQGHSYAIPTMQGGVETIKPYVDEFIEFASNREDLFFYVTRIGCGIAGFMDSDMAPLFAAALSLDNVCLPESFVRILNAPRRDTFPQLSRTASQRLLQQGQVRTLADIAKYLNDTYHFTNLRDFRNKFEEAVRAYQERGTVDADVCFVIGDLISRNERLLFADNGYLDFDELIKLVDDLVCSDDNNPLDVIYSRREKTKLLRLAALLNDMMHYTSSYDLFYDLCGISTGHFNCGDNSHMNDSFWYPLHFFKMGVSELWDEIQKDGYMNNELLEEKMFTEHERKGARYGLDRVIKEDFSQDICYANVYAPKRVGTAPVYILKKETRGHCGVAGRPVFAKSCGEGKGPNAYDSLYEMELVMPVLMRECGKEYRIVDDYFVPVFDDQKPIFQKYHGVLGFDNMREKKRLLLHLRTLANQNEDIR